MDIGYVTVMVFCHSIEDGRFRFLSSFLRFFFRYPVMLLSGNWLALFGVYT